MNNAHNGPRLGQALFKICDRLGIAHKVGHVTCDDATNMDTMLVEFAQWIKNHTGKTWIEKKHHIRCLAHVIHLAMRALISTHSKAPFYNPEKVELVIPFENGCCDEIGLV
ncbi:hypothetical protein PAXRUDRAFT_18813 [Paxillus rubicundulus Ve08.2h10]|uniref:Uncharacterized protein n=1 Tax=Paxillus rubicundulus Ve08.2h10 TaxID=930991 RepID=A0A0D0CWZ8_9AGAM|nr:hypothetical protein PAXRUDRAFT_18813 [Paxillus rubicundulus Ve08.2h10]